MRIEDYQSLAMRTSTEGHDRAENGCLGLIGESGEIVDAVKKWRFQSGDNPPVPVDKLIDECGDVLWYCAELAEGLDADMASAAIMTYARGVCGSTSLWCASMAWMISGDSLYLFAISTPSWM